MVKIIIDSAADFTKEEAESQGFVFMSMPITIGDKEYNDGIDLLPETFYELLEKEDTLPKTSQIVQYRYEEQIKQIVDNGDEVVVITISSKLSQTYENAKRACQNYGDKAYAVDSMFACLGEKILALYAMRLVHKNLSAKEIANELDIVKNNIRLYAIIDTLEYLKKGGRLSGTAAVVGSLLNIKPIISLQEGLVKNVGKTMGLKKGFKQLIDTVNGFGGINFDMPYGVIYSGNDKGNLNKFLEAGTQLWEQDNNPLLISNLGSTIGTHIGAGAVGVAFFIK